MYKQSSNCVVKSAPSTVNPKFVPATFGATTANKLQVTAKSQEPVLIKYLLIQASDNGVVEDLKIGNQSLNCSDSDISLALFKSSTQRKPAIGVAVDGNIQLTIDVLTDGDANVSAGYTCEAIESAPSMNEQGDAIDKFYGLGKVSVPAGGSAELSAQALRDAMLKSFVLHSHDSANAAKVTVADITIKGRSIFSGQASTGIGVDIFDTETQDFTLMVNTAISTNERVTVKLENSHTAAITVSGGGYCD
jgi:hypothetical protein